MLGGKQIAIIATQLHRFPHGIIINFDEFLKIIAFHGLSYRILIGFWNVRIILNLFRFLSGGGAQIRRGSHIFKKLDVFIPLLCDTSWQR